MQVNVNAAQAGLGTKTRFQIKTESKMPNEQTYISECEHLCI